jgi:DNA repair protein RecN (Recombination protein N)
VLHQLHITDLGVIQELDLEPAQGLTVLTGETGAGKTMITVGLSLALGARAGAHLVRSGASSAKVQARFDAPSDAQAWAEDGEVILARTVAADGRGAARIGGQLTTAAALAEVGERLVEISGQHQSLRLLESPTQLAFLDRSVGAAHLERVAAYRRAHTSLVRRRRERDELVEAARDRERAIDLLAYQVREIEAVAPRADETEGLAIEEARLGHAERLVELGDAAAQALAADGGAADAVSTAAAALDAIGTLDPGAAELLARARDVAAEVGDLASVVRAYRDALGVDPARLQDVRDRLAALKSLQRKYGPTDADVIAFAERAHEELTSLQTADQRLADIETALAVEETAVKETGATLSAARRRAAPRLADALAAHVRDLGMPTAALEVRVDTDDEPGPSGMDRVEVRFAPGEGQALLPLAKAASGGELSRVMLACRSVLADLDDVSTLVFDEVDAGIGGEAGLAVGHRLAALAAARQVLVVTHLPQIACFADRHVRVRKRGGTATAEVLDDRGRVVELSRMLAGLETSEHALSHAEELLDEAARARAGAG